MNMFCRNLKGENQMQVTNLKRNNPKLKVFVSDIGRMKSHKLLLRQTILTGIQKKNDSRVLAAN